MLMLSQISMITLVTPLTTTSTTTAIATPFSMYTVYALVKTNRPMSDSTWQCELDEAMCISLGDTYRNRISTANFMAFTALKAYNDISENLSECIFHSIMCDD